MAAHPQHWITPEEYLEIERAAEFKHEYFNGRMYLMPGGSYRHAKIGHNLSREIGNALKNGPCEVVGTDLRVRVSPDGLYTYPDLVVICGSPKFADKRTDTLVNPALLIEVLSPSTELLDREFKFEQYRKEESLKEYVLVSQTEARVEVYRRGDEGLWMLTEFVGLEGAVRFDSIEASVPLAEIYAKVDLAANEQE